MRPPVAAAALVGLLATAACATTGCASSVRMMHEGTTYFERCRAGELDPAVSIPQRSACWARWLEYYTDGQPEPRVAYAERRAAAEQALEEARLVNAWVAARAAEAARLAPAEAAPEQVYEPVGLSELEQGLKRARLWPYVKRLEARSQGGVALDFEEVEFTALMNWLERRDPEWGYRFESFRIEPRLQPAMVKASIVLRAAEQG